jgi:hypothetical protein
MVFVVDDHHSDGWQQCWEGHQGQWYKKMDVATCSNLSSSWLFDYEQQPAELINMMYYTIYIIPGLVLVVVWLLFGASCTA